MRKKWWLSLLLVGLLVSNAVAITIDYDDPMNTDDSTWTKIVTFDDPLNNDDVELVVPPQTIDDPKNNDDTIRY